MSAREEQAARYWLTVKGWAAVLAAQEVKRDEEQAAIRAMQGRQEVAG